MYDVLSRHVQSVDTTYVDKAVPHGSRALPEESFQSIGNEVYRFDCKCPCCQHKAAHIVENHSNPYFRPTV